MLRFNHDFFGSGLDDTFSKNDNGQFKGYNIGLPDVIELRNELLPAGERETNPDCNLNDFSWMERLII